MSCLLVLGNRKEMLTLILAMRLLLTQRNVTHLRRSVRNWFGFRLTWGLLQIDFLICRKFVVRLYYLSFLLPGVKP